MRTTSTTLIIVTIASAVSPLGCKTIKHSELCAEFEECPVFEVDHDRYPAPARDARIELTGEETGAWVTVTGGPEPVLGALGEPPAYRKPDPRPMLEFPPQTQPAPIPSCSELRDGPVPFEGVVSQRPAAVELDDGRVLVTWVEAKGRWVGSKVDETTGACDQRQQVDQMSLKVARFETGELEPCYSLRMGNEAVWDVAADASETKLHFAVSGGEGNKTHVRYFSVAANQLCASPSAE